MFTCPNCGCHDVEEITDGLWNRTIWEYDKETKKYIERGTKVDGCGEHYFQCAECDTQLLPKEEKNIYQMVLG